MFIQIKCFSVVVTDATIVIVKTGGKNYYRHIVRLFYYKQAKYNN